MNRVALHSRVVPGLVGRDRQLACGCGWRHCQRHVRIWLRRQHAACLLRQRRLAQAHRHRLRSYVSIATALKGWHRLWAILKTIAVCATRMKR